VVSATLGKLVDRSALRVYGVEKRTAKEHVRVYQLRLGKLHHRLSLARAGAGRSHRADAPGRVFPRPGYAALATAAAAAMTVKITTRTRMNAACVGSMICTW
jgi:hypothetical protein